MGATDVEEVEKWLQNMGWPDEGRGKCSHVMMQ